MVNILKNIKSTYIYTINNVRKLDKTAKLVKKKPTINFSFSYNICAAIRSRLKSTMMSHQFKTIAVLIPNPPSYSKQFLKDGYFSGLFTRFRKYNDQFIYAYV